ncbi:MAG: T9SS type A sorting domain-containing protein [Bacteroidetes bacterium]|nr:T9SS type A sorting domain-containing protein [Bacteroidota bacterium]
MRRIFLLLSIILLAGVAHAQEFKLKLTYTVDGTPWAHPLYMGYDPTASDSFDFPARWAMPEYPEGMVEVPSNDFGDVDCRFSGRAINRANLGSGCYIDVRKKPSSGGFELRYEVDLIANVATTAKLSWDQSSIPPIIKHMYLASSEKPDHATLDMTKTGEFNIPMDTFRLGKYRQTIITLLYNQDTLGVEPTESNSTCAIYPTVLNATGGAHVWLSEAGRYTISMIDAVGRVIRQYDLLADVGANRLPNSVSSVPAGTYTVTIRNRENGNLYIRRLIVQ